MKSKWPLKLARLFALTLPLMACASLKTGSLGTDLPIQPDGFCLLMQPFRWSHADTRESIEQAQAINLIGKNLCGWRGTARAAPGSSEATPGGDAPHR